MALYLMVGTADLVARCNPGLAGGAIMLPIGNFGDLYHFNQFGAAWVHPAAVRWQKTRDERLIGMLVSRVKQRAKNGT